MCNVIHSQASKASLFGWLLAVGRSITMSKQERRAPHPVRRQACPRTTQPETSHTQKKKRRGRGSLEKGQEIVGKDTKRHQNTQKSKCQAKKKKK